MVHVTASVSGTYYSDRIVYRFDSNGTITLDQDYTVRVLVIGGGGSGGISSNSPTINRGGGGGAGGMFADSTYTLPAGTYQITVGSGGTVPSVAGSGSNGGQSSIGSLIIARGGGGGGGRSTFSFFPALDGGSGGGAPTTNVAFGGVGSGSTAGTLQHSGGSHVDGGGGGGAGGAGNGNTGGAGAIFDIGDGNGSVTYASGGNGGFDPVAANATIGGGGGFRQNGNNGVVMISFQVLPPSFTNISSAFNADESGLEVDWVLGGDAVTTVTYRFFQLDSGTWTSPTPLANPSSTDSRTIPFPQNLSAPYVTQLEFSNEGGSILHSNAHDALSYEGASTIGRRTSGNLTYLNLQYTSTTSNVDLTVKEDLEDVDYLLVGGGGGGGISVQGDFRAGGGGAGGLIYQQGQSISAGSYPIVIGSGGRGAPGGAATVAALSGGNGGNSTAFGQTALGGGGGGGRWSANIAIDPNTCAGLGVTTAFDGGSGGGGSVDACTGLTSNPQQGTNGGGATNAGGGGGGGAASAGVGGGTTGDGGAGLVISISGSSVTYATGGDGIRSGRTPANKTAGTGDGGDGGVTATPPTAGASGVVALSILFTSIDIRSLTASASGTNIDLSWTLNINHSEVQTLGVTQAYRIFDTALSTWTNWTSVSPSGSGLNFNVSNLSYPSLNVDEEFYFVQLRAENAVSRDDETIALENRLFPSQQQRTFKYLMMSLTVLIISPSSIMAMAT